MFKFGDEIGCDAVTQNNLQRINHFLVLFLYSSHWMTATSTAKAPNNDLHLIHDMIWSTRQQIKRWLMQPYRQDDKTWMIPNSRSGHIRLIQHISKNDQHNEMLDGNQVAEHRNTRWTQKGEPVFQTISKGHHTCWSYWARVTLHIQCSQYTSSNWLSSTVDT